jgi:hypothetical protein
MKNLMEMLFGNTFFQLPFMEALAYIAAFLMVGAAIVGLPKLLMGTASQRQSTEFREEAYGEEWEWRKAA